MIITYSDGEMCYSRGRRGELQVPVVGLSFIFRSSPMIVTYSDGEMCYSRGRGRELQVPVAGLPFIFIISP